MVECNLAKVEVVGSNPISRSGRGAEQRSQSRGRRAEVVGGADCVRALGTRTCTDAHAYQRASFPCAKGVGVRGSERRNRPAVGSCRMTPRAGSMPLPHFLADLQDDTAAYLIIEDYQANEHHEPRRGIQFR